MNEGIEYYPEKLKSAIHYIINKCGLNRNNWKNSNKKNYYTSLILIFMSCMKLQLLVKNILKSQMDLFLLISWI